jgi:predicted nucleotide-binding protein
MSFYHVIIKPLREEQDEMVDIPDRQMVIDRYISKYVASKPFFWKNSFRYTERIEVFKTEYPWGFSDPSFEEVTSELVYEAEQLIQSNRAKNIAADSTKRIHDKSNKVFIVHGRDEAVKEKVARFVGKLNLTPIILHEQPNEGKTIIEKLETYTDVDFAVILYTPCDEGRLKGDQDFKARARQNVVFEHGLLIGKLGREKVCALVQGNDIEILSDINGVVYHPLDDHDGWHLKLAKELKSVGFNIDLNNI